MVDRSRTLVAPPLSTCAGTCAVRQSARATLLSDSLVRRAARRPSGRGKAGVNAVGLRSLRDRPNGDSGLSWERAQFPLLSWRRGRGKDGARVKAKSARLSERIGRAAPQESRSDKRRDTCRLHARNIRYRVAVIARWVNVPCGRSVARSLGRIDAAANRSRERRAVNTRLHRPLGAPTATTRTSFHLSSWIIARAGATLSSSCNRYGPNRSDSVSIDRFSFLITTVNHDWYSRSFDLSPINL